MSNSKPFLRQVFDKVERAVGGPLEQLVASKSYTDVILTINQLQKAIGGPVAGAASGAMEKVLHAVQLPTRSDVRRLSRQLVELATELRAVSAKLQEARPVTALPKARHTRQQVKTGVKAPAVSAKLQEAPPVAALAKARRTRAPAKTDRKAGDGT